MLCGLAQVHWQFIYPGFAQCCGSAAALALTRLLTPSTAQKPFGDCCSRGAGLWSPWSQPAIAHLSCRGKINGCVLGWGRWRQRESKLGVGQQRCSPVCSVQTLSPGAASAGTFPFPVICCPDAVEKAVASLCYTLVHY